MLIGTLIQFTPLATISSADVNSNFASIRETVNASVVFRDVPGTITVSHTFSALQTFSAGITVVGGITGNASTATALATARAFSITGDITAAGINFDGSGAVALSAAITAGAIVDADINAAAAIASSKLATVQPAQGGTGVTGTPMNGQLLIGNGSGFTLAALTAGANVTITPSAGGISIAAPDPGQVSDGDKGVIIVSGSGAVWAFKAGAIVNADINASAAIADTKLATISTAGKVANSATTATPLNTANAIVARDSNGDIAIQSVIAINTVTSGSNVAGSGRFRSSHGTDIVVGRNFANSADVVLLGLDTTDAISIGQIANPATAINFRVGGSLRASMTSTAFSPGTDNGLDIGGASLRFKDVHVMGVSRWYDGEMNRPLLSDYAEKINTKGSVAGAQTASMEDGNVVTATATGNITWTVTNPPGNGRLGTLTFLITAFGADRTMTWPASFGFGSVGAPPAIAVGTTMLVSAATIDGGTKYRCTWAGGYA